MGLNAFFTYTLVLGKGVPWQTALGIVFISGFFFLILSIGGIREKIANAIPLPLKIAVGGGIGMFITLIGLKNMGVVVANDSTLVALGPITTTVLIGIVGLIVSMVLEIERVKGGMLIGILVSTILAFITGNVDVPSQFISMPPSAAPIAMKLDIIGAFKLSLIGPIFSFMFVDLFDTLGTLISCSKQMGMVDEKGGMLIGILVSTILAFITGNVDVPSQIISMPPSAAPIAMKLDIVGALKLSLIGPIFSFMFVDLFDTLGTLISCSKQMGMVDEKGHIQGLGKMLYTDVSATIAGAMMGTSTVTTFVESAAGVAVGARTGFASVITALMFIGALFFSPIVGVVPAYATAPALIIVGGYMFKNVKDLDFTDMKSLFPAFIIIVAMPLTYSISIGATAPALIIVGGYMFKNVKDLDFTDMKSLFPAFIIIVAMPLTYSISIGLSLGFLAYILLHLVTGDFKKINFTLLFIGALCFVNLVV